LCNARYEGVLDGAQWVQVDESSRDDQRLYMAELADRERPWRHDASRLAAVLMDLYFERTGPLSD
jgi:hypothetical protein